MRSQDGTPGVSSCTKGHGLLLKRTSPPYGPALAVGLGCGLPIFWATHTLQIFFWFYAEVKLSRTCNGQARQMWLRIPATLRGLVLAGFSRSWLDLKSSSGRVSCSEHFHPL